VVYRACWRPVLDYIFTTLGCSRLQSHTRRSNKRVLRQLKSLGFNYEGVARRYYGREDAICYALTTDDLAQFREKWKL
jgi:RimJ/RimL family protein N-acetyltransferase